MSRAWYHFVGDEGVTVAERQTTSRKELEQDTEGTLTKLIIRNLELEELDEQVRQFIALPVVAPVIAAVQIPDRPPHPVGAPSAAEGHGRRRQAAGEEQFS